MNVLRVENLKVSYGEKEVLKGINFNIESGKIVSIIGPNGCGKTTLLKTISRNLKPNEGKILLNGKDVYKFKNKNLARIMATLSQSNVCPDDVSIKELVSYGRYAHKKFFSGFTKEDEEIINWAISRTGLNEMKNRKVITLSGGERQRAWIAMAIAQKPSILILDEPTTYLDISYQLELLDLIKSLNEKEKITIVMVLHDINQACKYSHELIVIKNGYLYEKGSPSKIINDNMLKEVFRLKAYINEDKDTKKPIIYPKEVFSKLNI
ncbi:ATP-binding cassette domain-containing protein [Clostridium senegalense]|uniref:ABC transporter ATP-binding protein n=1 Tax=Clostridium senegalense TaxID=1465809 RepID=A0A6M0H248_9CLOT|nr:ABC transporter ATP-binding protein [Clostridium senegalense]